MGEGDEEEYCREGVLCPLEDTYKGSDKHVNSLGGTHERRNMCLVKGLGGTHEGRDVCAKEGIHIFSFEYREVCVKRGMILKRYMSPNLPRNGSDGRGKAERNFVIETDVAFLF